MLSRDYPIKDICELMEVSRSGYYKWRNRSDSNRKTSRGELLKLVGEVHQEHPTHGYRWVAAYIRTALHRTVSDNFVYKCFRNLGLQSKTRHKPHYKPRKIKDKYPNLIFSTWDTVDRPRQVIVSDMTVLKAAWFYVELTLYFDVFTKEILAHKVAEQKGSNRQYIDGLEDVVGLLRGAKQPAILHTDQGSVYASMAYNELIKDTVIERSMSRAGKPTDNPVNESLNGWIKEELYIDFNIGKLYQRQQVVEAIDKYVEYYNKQRPSYALGYDTPENYRKRYYKGEIPKRDTFANRQLSETPKFVTMRKNKPDNQENA